MKYFLLFFLLFPYGNFNAAAQKNTVLAGAYGAIGVGSLLGNVGDYYYLNGKAPKGNIAFTGSFSAGFQAGYMFSNRVGVVSGFTWDQSAWKYETSGGLRKSKTTSQQRLQIPLLLRMEAMSRRKNKVGGYFFNLGGNVSFLQKIKENINGPIAASVESEFSPVTYALQGDMGGMTPLSENIWLIVGTQGQIQLSNNFQHSPMNGHLTSLTFFVGLHTRL